MSKMCARKYVSDSERMSWQGWVGVFLAITILLLMGGVLLTIETGDSEGDFAILRNWIIVSSALYCIVMVTMAVMAVKYRRLAVREYMMAEREKNETSELMRAVCSNFNAVYFCDYLKNEIKIIQVADRTNDSITYDELYPLDRYLQTYCEKTVADNYKCAFMKNVCPENIREKLKDRDYFTYIYVGDDNGDARYFQMKAAKVNGSENYFIVGFEDVNEQVRENEVSAQLLRDAIVQTERSNKTKADFLARITADFMNPLNTIVVAAKTLEAEGATSLEKETKKILAAAGNLDTMISETLDAGYINSGKKFIDSKPFNLSKLIGDASEMIKYKTEGSDVSFSLNVQLVHEILIGDSHKLQSVIKHIALFAIENVEAGRNITVNILETQVLNRKAYFDVFFDMPNVYISDADKEKILTDDKCNDAGYIGLSIAGIMTNMMGGKMEIDNNTAIGTSIKLHLSFNYER